MPTTSISHGGLVYVRAYSTRRAAVAELVTLFQRDGADWGRVRLMTDWYDWDEVPAAAGPSPQAGELLQLEAFRLEAVRK
jgi:hypothetical protein